MRREILSNIHTACMPRILGSLVLLSITFVIPFSAIANEADVAAGQARSAVCHSCHGTAGISSNPSWPNLAGQKSGYLIKQLKSFRDGRREDPLMSPMAAPLTDEDIRNIAAYYASLTDS